jgi:electron transfer flavoprotein alpha subunit
MSTFLVFVATSDGKIKRSSLEVLSQARSQADKRGMSLAAAVVDTDANRYTDEIQSYGAKTIYAISNPVFKTHLNASLIQALSTIIDTAKPSIFACASTEATKDVLGALGVNFNAGVLPDVASFELTDDGVSALRPVMAAKVLSQNSANGDLILISVRSGSYDSVKSPVTAEVKNIDFQPSDFAAVLREILTSAGEKVDLSEAQVVVAAGRGVKDSDGQKLVEELSEVLGAAIGASRAVVETGLFPATAQIGQTGKVVSPQLYFAIGISGAVQHTAGMANSKVIVAINKDADAPIFQMATYGLVGDLFKILPLLTEELRKIKQSA